jgi:hypothetical protein
MSLNWITLAVVVVLQYVIGALWYSVFFKNQWIKINHPDGMPSPEEMGKMGKEAIPYFGIQFGLTVMTAIIQWYVMANSSLNWLIISILIWGGFLVPTLIQSVIWSDPRNKKKLMQIGIVTLNLLVNSLLAGYLFATFR